MNDSHWSTRVDIGEKVRNPQVKGADDADHIEDVVTSLAAYPGVKPIPCNGAEYVGGIRGLDSESARIPSDAKPADVDFSYDVSIISPYIYTKLPGCRYSFFRLKSLGKVASQNYGVRHAARLIYGRLNNDGSFLCDDERTLFWKGPEGFIVQVKHVCGHSLRHGSGTLITKQAALRSEGRQDQINASVLLGMAFLQPLTWGVYLGLPGRRIRLSSDPAAIREFFKLRDAGQSGRRAALRHWVKGHWRKRSSAEENEDAKSWVRQHLRGKLDFVWNGIDCTVAVSRSDIALYDRLKANSLDTSQE